MKIRLLELCAGYGSQALALKNLGIDVYSEIAEFDKYASQAYMQLHGETKNYGDIYTIDETKLPYFDMITYSTPCFTEDSLVLTEKRGFQKIIDIQIGEKVITHDGNYKTVENVINNGKKKTVKIYGMGIDEIHTTPNHLFYVREKSHVWNNKTRSYTRVFSEVYKQPYSIYKTERPKTTVIEGRTVNQKDTYELCFKKEKRPQDKAFYEDGFIWFPVTKVEEDEIETIYDLTVEENHSFTVQGVIVHNCQDFSVAGKGKGGDKGSGTRSSLLWECERIIRAVKPKYLLMENVKNLLSDKHRHNFNEWFKVLESMGYTNYYKVLNAKDYGIPQNRERIFCVSILGGGQYLFPNPKPLEKRLKDMLEDNVDEKYYLSDISVNRLLKRRDGLGYKPCINGEVAVTLTTKPGQRNSDNYIQEPFVVASRGRNIENPSDRTIGSPTEQRLEINYTGCTNTLTSVQKDNYVVENYRIRKLTARECFRLMGVKDEQFDRLNGISNSQLYKLAGNSIVVDVLEAIFKNLLMPETTETKGQLSLF